MDEPAAPDGRGTEPVDDEESAENDDAEGLFCGLPDGAGCVEIWDRLSEARDDE